MNKKKAGKSRRKRWFKSRVKTQRKEKFKEAFRQHFVNKGILKNN